MTTQEERLERLSLIIDLNYAARAAGFRSVGRRWAEKESIEVLAEWRQKRWNWLKARAAHGAAQEPSR